MVTAFQVQNTGNGAYGGALTPSDTVNTKVLAAGSAETETVPAGAGIVVFSANNDFYANFNGPATVASADITNGSGSVLNPTVRKVTAGDEISLIAPVDTIVTMEYFAI